MQYISGKDENWSRVYMKKKLLDYFGEKIIITEIPGKVGVLTFKGKSHQLLSDKWYESRKSDMAAERLRIVEAAAAIVREDIRGLMYEVEKYPSSESIMDGGVLPETLSKFVNSLLSKDTSDCKSIALQNVIISNVRKRSYISPVRFGLAVHLHRRYGSRHLLDLLSNLGFCESYTEILKFESSDHNKITISENAFTQWVYDNADFNTRTLDGHKTFHAMGGVVCIYPAESVKVSDNTIRPKKYSEVLKKGGGFGCMPIKNYIKPPQSGFKSLLLSDLSEIVQPSNYLNYLLHDTLWHAGHIFETPASPSWSGFMSLQKSENTIIKTRILPVPFINLDPNNLSSIYTAITFSIN